MAKILLIEDDHRIRELVCDHLASEGHSVSSEATGMDGLQKATNENPDLIVLDLGLPDLEGRAQILRIHARSMSCDRDIRFELIARLCPNTTGAELRSVCTEAGMYAIRGRRKSVSEKDFLDSVNKVIKGYKKFSSTPKYMVYN